MTQSIADSKLGCKKSNYSCSEKTDNPNGLTIEDGIGDNDYMLDECLSNIWKIEGYKNNLPYGEYEEWSLNKNGKYYLSCKGKYNDGIKYGLWEYYDINGKVIQTKSH